MHFQIFFGIFLHEYVIFVNFSILKRRNLYIFSSYVLSMPSIPLLIDKKNKFPTWRHLPELIEAVQNDRKISVSCPVLSQLVKREPSSVESLRGLPNFVSSKTRGLWSWLTVKLCRTFQNFLSTMEIAIGNWRKPIAGIKRTLLNVLVIFIYLFFFFQFSPSFYNDIIYGIKELIETNLYRRASTELLEKRNLVLWFSLPLENTIIVQRSSSRPKRRNTLYGFFDFTR